MLLRAAIESTQDVFLTSFCFFFFFFLSVRQMKKKKKKGAVYKSDEVNIRPTAFPPHRITTCYCALIG